MPTLMTPKETAQAMQRNLEAKTGRPLEGWLAVLKEKNFAAEKDAAAWLKKDQGLGHFQAQLVARAAFDRSWTDEYAEPDSLLNALYSGKKSKWRALHERVITMAKGIGADVKVSVCKTYVSAYRKRQFVVVRPVASGLEVKLLIGDRKARTESVTVVKTAQEVNKALQERLAKAYLTA